MNVKFNHFIKQQFEIFQAKTVIDFGFKVQNLEG